MPNNPFNPIAAKTRLRVNGTFGCKRIMNTALISDLRRLAGESSVELVDEAEHVAATFARSGLAVKAVIPRTVSEFFIEVTSIDGVKIEDWLDYAGYDVTPASQLAEEMRADVIQFIGRLLTRELRIASGGKSIEWRAGDRWLQAVPFVPDAYEGEG